MKDFIVIIATIILGVVLAVAILNMRGAAQTMGNNALGGINQIGDAVASQNLTIDPVN